jgi:hypothetical protein
MGVGKGAGYVRNEAGALFAIWFLIRDAIEGEPAIKGQYACQPDYVSTRSRIRRKAEYYLPKPNPTDTSKENDARYEAYVKRAVWYGFTGRTLEGMVGQIFLRPPVKQLPKQLDPLLTDADGEGLTLEQVAKRTAQSALAYGRAGLLTDYPTTAGPVTPEQIKTGNLQPVIKHYYPWQIRNWATKKVGAKYILSLVVLEEVRLIEVDDFELEEEVIYRCLRLDADTGNYKVEVWGEDEAATEAARAINKDAPIQYKITETYWPTKQNGQNFTEIPFSFVGSEANDIWCDRPPLYDLASLNIAHYRNSADYEESCFLAGQPTLTLAGLDQPWVDNVLKGVVQMGSRSAIPLPVGAKAELLQANPNQMPLEAMKLKEDQALALGAKLVQKQRTTRTATEVQVDQTAESSTLHNVSKNTSAALENNCKWAGEFAGASPEDIDAIQFQLNTEFELMRMNANDRLALIKMWQSGGIAWPELREALRVDGIATMDDDEALEYIQKEQAAAATLGGAPIADPLQAGAPTAPENTPAPAQPGSNPTPGQNVSVPVAAAR